MYLLYEVKPPDCGKRNGSAGNVADGSGSLYICMWSTCQFHYACLVIEQQESHAMI